MTDTLQFDAEVVKVQTLVDDGIRLTLDLPETAITEAAVLMELKRQGIAIRVTVEKATCKAGENRDNGEVSKRAKRQSKRTPAKE